MRLATENGAVGLLLYPDPEDFTTLGSPGYPNAWDLPPIGIPRGTLTNVKGDPLTPRLPATGSERILLLYSRFSIYQTSGGSRGSAK